MSSATAVQDFSGLLSSGSGSVLPPGWLFLETGSNANGTYAAGSGTSNAGNTYSFGTGTSSERALGTLRSGSLISTIGAVFLNDTGGTVTSIDVVYWGEQWRLGTAGRQDRLDFQYSVDATSLSNGTWSDVNDLDFSTLVPTSAAGATNGDDPLFREQRQGTIAALNIPPGGLLWIRWNDFDASGADDGLAVDDFSLSASTSDVPPVVVGSFPASGALDVDGSSPFEVTFSEPVDLAPGWSDVECEQSGTHDVSALGGPVVYSVEVVGDLAAAEDCVWTIRSSGVTDQDGTSDEMTQDVAIEFATQGASGCGAPATAIHVVQGAGATSPRVGDTVTIEAVVVGDFRGSTGLGGFFVQEEDTDVDADPQTSEGLFVSVSAGVADVSFGDVVRIVGRVTEYFGLTELDAVTSLEVCGAGNVPSPAPLVFPLAAVGELEAYEGMRVSLQQSMVVSETYDLGRYGELLLSVGTRLMQPTQVAEPGVDAQAVQSLNQRSAIQLDDGSSIQNPTTVPYLGEDGTLRLGDRIDELSGVLGYAFGVYEIHPTAPVTFSRTNPRPAPPPPPGQNLRVASFNVLNYFTTLDNGAAICGPSANLECRGANTASEFSRQRQKTLAAISAADADVVGLVEVENNASAAVQDLVDGLNAAMGPGTYSYVATGTIGTDAIKVAMLYKPSRVSLVGTPAILDSSVDPDFADTRNRPILAQTFRFTPSGEVLTIAVNHLKSKGSACSGDPDLGDLQGNCNLTRLAAAEAEVGWLASDPTGSNDSDVLLVGDFNAYAKEDPVVALQDAGYTNLVGAFSGPDARSYVFEGQSGYLDYAFASASLVGKVQRVWEWHINADEPRILDYNQEFNPPELFQPNAFRAADHDPLIVDIAAPPAPPSAVPIPRAGGWTLGSLLLVFGATLILTRSLRGSAPLRLR